MHWQILNIKAFIHVGYGFRYSIDNMRDFIADDELNILNWSKRTFAAN